MAEPIVTRQRRSRPAKACNTCRRKKVKCDGKRPVCSSCSIFELPCAFQEGQIVTRRSNRSYIEELEQQVKALNEQVCRLTQTPTITPEDAMNASLSGPDDSPVEFPVLDETEVTTRGQSPGREESRSTEMGSHQPSYVLRAAGGKMRFYGSSAGYSIILSKEAKATSVKQPTVVKSYKAQRRTAPWPLSNWIPPKLRDDFEQRASQLLPSKEATMTLVSEFLSTFNRTIPLVSDGSLLQIVERRFSWNPDNSPSAWVLLNIVLAFSYRERATRSADGSDEWNLSLGHVRNALDAVTELYLRNADLHAVQGLLGLALYFQGTPNAQALFMFGASAMRIAQSIGLHTNTTSSFSYSEIRDRRRTFWLVFMLDADLCCRAGGSPVQDMDDYDIPLPSESAEDGKGIVMIDGVSVNFFRLLAEFAVVQRKIYRQLQTVAVVQQPKEAALKAALSCEASLMAWKQSAGKILEPDHMFNCQPPHCHQHLLRLALSYHCCYTNLRILPQLATAGDSSATPDGNAGFELELTALNQRTVDSARWTLTMLPHVQAMGVTSTWGTVYYFAAATAALSSDIRRHTTCERGHLDLDLIRGSTEFMTTVSQREPDTFVDFMLSLCITLESSAKRAVHAVGQAKEGHPATKVHSHDYHRRTGQGAFNMDGRGQEQSVDMINSDIDIAIDGIMSLESDPNNFNEETSSQWSIPPFWNWQELFMGIPSPQERNR